MKQAQEGHPRSRTKASTRPNACKGIDAAGGGPREQLVRMQMPISQIKPNPRNPRTHSGKQIRQIVNSIIEFGFITPLVVTEDGELIAGHGRFKAAELLVSLSETQARM